MFKRQAFLASIAIALALGASLSRAQDALTLRDAARQHDVPVPLYRPNADGSCSAERQCPVVFLSPGTGLANTAYSFLVQTLVNTLTPFLRSGRCAT